jgi:GNAT superfamily N-acetyltransferase
MDGGSGRCLCGTVRYAFDGTPNWQAHCHCESCRRNCSAPFTSYFAVNHGKWRWTAALPQIRVSSPGVRRHFCGMCGTPMAFEGDKWAHELHFYAASLDDPAAYRPTLHVNWNEHLPWVKLNDGLPVHRTPRRLEPGSDFAPLLTFIRRAFAYMEGRIDPPSSILRMAETDMDRMARDGEVWVADESADEIAASVILTPRVGHLYLGKLAVAERLRGQGIARQMVKLASSRARDLGLRELRLQTRVELAENHAAFMALGFHETGRSAHLGYDRPTTVDFAKGV